MVDQFDMPVQVPVEEQEAQPKKTRTPKAVKQKDALDLDGGRGWLDVVRGIREMQAEGATVPQMAETLNVSYVLVNQVLLQSYQMTVDTLALFARQEKLRGVG